MRKENAAVKPITLSDEDIQTWFEYAYSANEQTARNTAADAGVEEQMEVMLTALNEKLAE